MLPAARKDNVTAPWTSKATQTSPETSPTGVSQCCFLGKAAPNPEEAGTLHFFYKYCIALGGEKSFHINPGKDKDTDKKKKKEFALEKIHYFFSGFSSSWTISFISSCALLMTSPWAQRPLGPCQKSSWGGIKAVCIKKMWTKPVAWIQVSLYHSPYSACYLESNGTERSRLNLVSITALSQTYYKGRVLRGSFLNQNEKKRLHPVFFRPLCKTF